MRGERRSTEAYTIWTRRHAGRSDPRAVELELVQILQYPSDAVRRFFHYRSLYLGPRQLTSPLSHKLPADPLL